MIPFIISFSVVLHSIFKKGFHQISPLYSYALCVNVPDESAFPNNVVRALFFVFLFVFSLAIAATNETNKTMYVIPAEIKLQK